MTESQIVIAGHEGLSLSASVVGVEGGPPVLLAHGGGQTRRAWRGVARLLGTRGFCATALDMRGHGESSWAPNGAYSIHDFAEDLVAVARHFGRRPHLIGASLGGLAGLIAEGDIAPGTFSSLTLVDITPRMEAVGVDRIVGFMSAHAREGFASPEEAAKIISEYLPHRPSRTASVGLQAYLRRKENGRYYWHWDPAFIEGVTRSRTSDGKWKDHGRDAFSAAAASLRLPVHLIRGGSTDLVSPEAAAHFLELAPHAEFSDIADATHMVAGDKNDAFGQAILRFLGNVCHAEKTS